jgi:hypothetical protein
MASSFGIDKHNAQGPHKLLGELLIEIQSPNASARLSFVFLSLSHTAQAEGKNSCSDAPVD